MILKKQIVFSLLSLGFSLYSCQSSEKSNIVKQFFSQNTEKKEFFNFVTRPRVLTQEELGDISDQLDIDKSIINTERRRDSIQDCFFRAVTIQCVYHKNLLEQKNLPGVIFGIIVENN